MKDENGPEVESPDVESPCVNICVVHPEARVCTGCLRSIEEITVWSRLSNAARQAIVDDLPGREAVLKKRRGGRKGRLARDAGEA